MFPRSCINFPCRQYKKSFVLNGCLNSFRECKTLQTLMKENIHEGLLPRRSLCLLSVPKEKAKKRHNLKFSTANRSIETGVKLGKVTEWNGVN